MSSIKHAERALADYSPSLKQAARALWGDDFWGSHAPRPADKAQPPKR